MQYNLGKLEAAASLFGLQVGEVVIEMMTWVTYFSIRFGDFSFSFGDELKSGQFFFSLLRDVKESVPLFPHCER